MPKKVHGRPPAKTRQRTRRPNATVTPGLTVGSSPENGIVAEPRPVPAAVHTAVVSGARPAPRPSGSTAAKRPASSARKTPGIVINYHYLRRDIRTLGVLATSMVVLLVIAFFVFR